MKAKHLVQSLLSVSLIMGAVVLGMPRTVSAQGEKDIVETAVAAGSFKTLVAAVQATGLLTRA